MDRASHREMRVNINRYLLPASKGKESYIVLDVGSQLIVDEKNLQRTYKELMDLKWTYIGLDIVSGVNVDIVIGETMPFNDNSANAFISGNCLEHCENPFSLVKEMSRVVKPDGYVIISAPFNQPPHTEIDRWRFLPQGFESLFKYSGLKCITTYLSSSISLQTQKETLFCWGVAKKRD